MLSTSQSNSQCDFPTYEPTSPQSESLLKEINSQLKSKNYSKVEELILALIPIDSNPLYSVKLAHIWFIQGKYTEAEETYKKILSTVPENLKKEVLFGLGQVYFDKKQYSDAYMAFSTLENSYPDFKQIDCAYLKIARIMLMFQDYESAGKYLNKIIEQKNCGHNLIAEALVFLGYIKEKQGNRNECIELCKRAVRISRGFKIIASFIFILLKSKPEASEKLCRQALAKHFSDYEWSDLFLLRALAAMKLKDYKLAIEMLKGQLDVYPDSYIYQEFLGIMYLYDSQNSKALEIFHRVREKRPYDTVNLMNLSYCYKCCGYGMEAWHILNVFNEVTGRMADFNDIQIVEPDLDIFSFPTIINYVN